MQLLKINKISARSASKTIKWILLKQNVDIKYVKIVIIIYRIKKHYNVQFVE